MTPLRSEIQASHLHLNAACAWMTDICGPHVLESRRPEQVNFSHAGARLPSMDTVLGSIAYGTDVSIGIQGLDAYSVSLPLEGRQWLHGRGTQVRSDAHLGLVVTPFEAQRLEIDANCRKLQVVVRRQAMQMVAEAMLQRPLDEPIRFDMEMDTHCAAVAAWWQGVRQLVEGWPTLRALYAQAPLAQDLEMLLIKGLLLAQPNNYSAWLHQETGLRCPEYLIKARQYLQQHARENIRSSDIERACGVSRFKLYEVFRRYHALTPMAYLKHYRLRAVRAALLSGRRSASVSSVALEWGFAHLGRFACDYRKAFGETPSATVARMR